MQLLTPSPAFSLPLYLGSQLGVSMQNCARSRSNVTIDTQAAWFTPSEPECLLRFDLTSDLILIWSHLVAREQHGEARGGRVAVNAERVLETQLLPDRQPAMRLDHANFQQRPVGAVAQLRVVVARDHKLRTQPGDSQGLNQCKACG